MTYMVRFDLPDMSTREKLLDQYLLDAIASVPNIVKAEQLKQWVKRNIKSWASLSDGFSGRDIKSIAVRLKWKLLSAKNPVSEDLDGFMLKVFDNVRIKQSDLPDDVKKSNAIPAMAAAAA
jgi:AAA+ superfamily predicted ATPase